MAGLVSNPTAVFLNKNAEYWACRGVPVAFDIEGFTDDQSDCQMVVMFWTGSDWDVRTTEFRPSHSVFHFEYTWHKIGIYPVRFKAVNQSGERGFERRIEVVVFGKKPGACE